jgi:hypothetical protein
MGANTPKASRSSRTVAQQKLVDGFQKHQALLTQLFIQGELLTVPQLVARIDRAIAVADRAVVARAAWLAAVKEDLAMRRSMGAFFGAMRAALLAAFSAQIDILADFGLMPRAVPVLTPEEKQAAVAKAKATRVARHTMGKKQKAAITGVTAAAAAAAAASSGSSSQKKE